MVGIGIIAPVMMWKVIQVSCGIAVGSIFLHEISIGRINRNKIHVVRKYSDIISENGEKTQKNG